MYTYNCLNQFTIVWNQLHLAGATITKPVVHRRQVHEGSFSCAMDLLKTARAEQSRSKSFFPVAGKFFEA